MKIFISGEAKKWFTDEMDAEPGDHVRFYARYGGSSPLHEGFSLGVMMDQPIEAAVEEQLDGITFFIEEKDLWYFSGHDLHVSVDESKNELSYRYE